MRKIGQIIEDARTKKNFSLKKLEEITKIKTSFIESIEKENWQALPSFTIVLGFVKSIASALDIDEKTAVATLKRDYPPKKLYINPKPDVLSRFSWSPKLTFIIGMALVVITILGYLTFQYVRFISPPKITIDSPINGQVVSGGYVMVFGSTDSDVKILINNQPVLTDEDGKFSVKIDVSPTTSEIIVKGISRSGKEGTISRKITVQ
jgi:transcriptional regulator with XRE-family HTH domain